ncbi:C6 zinc finger domain protein [Aspergillus steynii IBT 23096]|uniref:C6 zinc finger domain protein n=1 Tax=Aspergillus steynii IBT 23096 TaxID=1392250 RepID=A0A2I2G921_9EURO|nr:C6 zinc finger domain protein [Aspergillus steynii IBT 23096]PLB49374.1 C6 zinc finger domain protein [Aspergillus steynii IBT 23096]
MHKLGRKARSKTGCRTCRIRKVKCDEEKLAVAGHREPQCRRCAAARILCEWKGGPIPRRAAGAAPTAPGPSKKSQATEDHRAARKRTTPLQAPLLPARDSSPEVLQAANSLALSHADRACLAYLQDSALVMILGKHWPWSTISYAYHRVAVREPMVMSMILASSSSEIHRSRRHDVSARARSAAGDSCDLDGRSHYGRAMAGLRDALQRDVKSPAQIEAVFITLWLMVDYENRFGSGAAGINVHVRGILSMLSQHVVPLLKPRDESLSSPPAAITAGLSPAEAPAESCSMDGESSSLSQSACAPVERHNGKLRSTSVPLFLLWTLYFFTPGALFCGPGSVGVDEIDLFRCFIRAESGTTELSLPELYRISRQSPARFWGEAYPVTAQLDDMENLPGLTLYHRSHVTQFHITEFYRQGLPSCLGSSAGAQTSYRRIVDEIATISDEFDSLLSSAKAAPSCEIAGDGRRVMETVYWASITFYSTIVYLHLCTADTPEQHREEQEILSLGEAVSLVLELALKLHRSRPRLTVRIVWPLFLAGIATRDAIYQDWVSIRLRELGRYGQNYSRVSLALKGVHFYAFIFTEENVDLHGVSSGSLGGDSGFLFRCVGSVIKQGTEETKHT